MATKLNKHTIALLNSGDPPSLFEDVSAMEYNYSYAGLEAALRIIDRSYLFRNISVSDGGTIVVEQELPDVRWLFV